MKLSMNVTTTFHGNTVSDIRIAKEAGFGGIELQSPKLYRYLDAGLAVESLLPRLEGLAVSGVGALQEAEPTAFAAEARKLAQITQALGSPMMQMCSGPVEVGVVKDHRSGVLPKDDKRYHGAVGRSEAAAVEMTAANLATAADIAAEYGLDVYLEPLGWAPVNSIKQALRIIEAIDRPNAGITVDFWHCFVAGDTPEDVARIDPAVIKAVHVCDGLALETPDTIPDQDVYRNVVTGGGVIPLQEYVDAVKSTGYDGWYCSEMFCQKTAELDFLDVARAMRLLMEILVS
jgi:sugar phosphate isomerase/epimerase